MMTIKDLRVLILSAGKINNELAKIFGEIPSGLIPINGKPAIFRIIDKLLDEGIVNISITVGYKKEIFQEIINEQYKNQCNLDFISTDYQRPPGNSIKTSMEYCCEKKILVILGDTLIDNNLNKLMNKDRNFVLTSENFVDSKNWCVITKKQDKIDEIFDKKYLDDEKKYYALVGCYFFNNFELLKSTLESFSENDNLEISSIIERIKEKEEFDSVNVEKWHDVGHLENYFSTKQFVLKTRYFNTLQFDDQGKSVVKTSTNNEKLVDEINWYKSVPKDLQDLIPKVLDSSTKNNPFVKLEYIKNPTLSELWLYSEFLIDFWKAVITDLFAIIQRFKNHKGQVTRQEYNLMYFEKTSNRINELVETDILFKKIFDENFILINNKKFKNWKLLKEKIKEAIDVMYDDDDNCLIHGDLYFSNILYDAEEKNFKLIDPRGKWGNNISGDIKYDLAKIRHSIVGGFDTIINGLYSANYLGENRIEYKIFNSKNNKIIGDELDRNIGKNWKLDEIKIIEGLLFISMLPLHKDNPERQLALFCVGIERLNEIFGD
tara:strand:- start:443 stop:2086 length:1644 start_codon:yes stop_codon:yes gene_type:complete